MVKGIVVCLFLLLPAFLAYSVEGSVYGIVKSQDGKPIEFCLVKSVNSDHSAYSNERGEFSIYAILSDSLILTCLGYEAKKIRIDNDTLKVVLKRKANKLDEVTVSADQSGGRTKQGILGKRNLKPWGICTGDIGNEIAIFLDGDSTRYGLLENIYFYITKEGIPSSRFRVHVYDIDYVLDPRGGYTPNEELLDSTVILHANTGDEWVSVDVSSRHIPVGKGVFISMEWISGYGNIERKVRSAKYTAQTPFNGQVLSGTEGYWKKRHYYRKNIHSAWHYMYSGGSLKKNVVNPMIYATYTYHKKWLQFR